MEVGTGGRSFERSAISDQLSAISFQLSASGVQQLTAAADR
jgi:hypothetical protein